jgi:hypothetical protein
MQEKVELQLVTGTFWASSFFVSEKNQRQCDGVEAVLVLK